MNNTVQKILLCILCILLLGAGSVGAQTATPTSSQSAEKTNKIEALKDRLATVVAELRHTQRRAISGTIKSTSLTTAIIETKTKDLKIELLDELTVFQVISGKRTKLTVDDLAQGDRVAVFGEYDTTLDLMKAKVVFIQSPLPVFIAGTVSAVDTKGFSLTVQPQNGPSYIVDIEKNTVAQKRTEGTTVAKSGFTQILPGDTVHVAGTLVPKETNRLSALRILNLGNMSGTTTPTPSPVASASATPKATSSATIKPTVKATPTPTP